MNKEKRIKDLKAMLEIDEPEMWATSTITPEEAKKEIKDLEDSNENK